MKLKYPSLLLVAILCGTACQKNGNDVKVAAKANTTTQTVTTATITPVATPTVTPAPALPYTDTFYGKVMENDWQLLPGDWVAASVHVYVLHNIYSQVIFSSDTFTGKVFNAKMCIRGSFPADSANYYPYSWLTSDGWGITYNFKLTSDSLIYNYSNAYCPDDDIQYYAGYKVSK